MTSTAKILIILLVGILIGSISTGLLIHTWRVSPLEESVTWLESRLAIGQEAIKELTIKEDNLSSQLKEISDNYNKLELDNRRCDLWLESEMKSADRCTSILYSMDTVNVQSGVNMEFKNIDTREFTVKFSKAVHLINVADKTFDEIDDYYMTCESASMRPTFDCDDVLIGILPTKSNLYVGDIVWFDIGEDSDVIHRIVSIGKDKYGSTTYTTRGDSNQGDRDEWVTRIKDIKFKIIGIIYG